MTFLNLVTIRSAYVRKAAAEYVGDYFAEPYRAAVELASDAVDTGHRRQGEQLWLSPDRMRAYVGAAGPPTVELWPRDDPATVVRLTSSPLLTSLISSSQIH